MPRSTLLACCLMIGLCLGSEACSRKPEDPEAAVVARVNGETILRADLDRQMLRVDKSFSVRPSPSEEPRLSREVLYQMIRRRLLLMAAASRGITLSAEERRGAILAERGGIAKEDFEKLLQKAGMSYDEWDQQIMEDRLIEALIHQVVDPRVKIREEELQADYQAHLAEFNVPERVRVRQIVLADKDTAESVRERLTRGGEDFGRVAQEVSLSPDAEQGGLIGTFAQGMMPREFDEVCFSLQIGEVSGVVKSPYGYHIFLVEDRLPAQTLPFPEVRQKIYDRLFTEKREQAFAEYQKELWNQAKISLLLPSR